MNARKLSIIAALLFSAGLQAETQTTDIQSLENISRELVTLRQQIAKLHDEINFKKDSFNDQIRSYANQKSDLEVKSSRSDLSIKELQLELDKLKALNKEKFEVYDEITPVLKNAIAQVRSSVSASLPFKLQDRLQALKDIEYRLDAQLISPNKAANQLWAFIEDELILGRSSGIHNETIVIDGQERLVKVLRLGKIALFYKTPQAGYGVLRKQSGTWSQEAIVGRDSARQLDQLFDSFSKNIRNGLFTVPNFLPNS